MGGGGGAGGALSLFERAELQGAARAPPTCEKITVSVVHRGEIDLVGAGECVAHGLTPGGAGSLSARGGGAAGETAGKTVATTWRTAPAQAPARAGAQGGWMEAEPTDAERLLHTVRQREPRRGAFLFALR